MDEKILSKLTPCVKTQLKEMQSIYNIFVRGVNRPLTNPEKIFVNLHFYKYKKDQVVDIWPLNSIASKILTCDEKEFDVKVFSGADVQLFFETLTEYTAALSKTEDLSNKLRQMHIHEKLKKFKWLNNMNLDTVNLIKKDIRDLEIASCDQYILLTDLDDKLSKLWLKYI